LKLYGLAPPAGLGWYAADAGSGDPTMRLTGKAAIVTGAGRGFGEGIAAAFVREGARVAVLDLNRALAASVAANLGDGAIALTADVSNGAEVEAAVRTALAAFGRLDIVVNNAGIQHVAPLQDFPPEKWDAILAINLSSAFHTTRLALPGMIRHRWGRIINIASAHGLVASPFKSAYVAAKHGLEGLSKVTALEGAPHGATSNCINPGYVNTALVQKQIADQAAAHGIPESEVVEKVMLVHNPIKRMVDPDDVASLALWLAGPHASMVTGASYTIDGGWTAQ
jgi:3-hydroxybutyrate dehydrogenase